MANELTGSQMLALTAALNKSGFGPAITAEIIGFVRARCLAGWAPEAGAPVIQPATSDKSRSATPPNEQDAIVASLVEMGAIRGDDSEAGHAEPLEQSDILASLANLGAIKGD